jgi:ATP-dependent RNA helicase DDX35
VLQLKSLGIDNILNFDFLSPPPPEMMIRALELLFSLGALNSYAKLTDPLGFQIAEFPVEPMLSAMVFEQS